MDGARAVVEAGRQLTPTALQWWAMQAWIEAASGHHDRAEELLGDRPVGDLRAADASYVWILSAVGAAVAASTLAEPAWAQAAHEALVPYGGRNCVLGYAAYLGAVDHHLGTLDAVLGRHDDAVEHLSSALDRHRVIDAHPWAALSAAWLANALADRDGRGDVDRAVTLHADSRRLGRALALAPLPPAHPKLSD
jgi:hypothetical protein